MVTNGRTDGRTDNIRTYRSALQTKINMRGQNRFVTKLNVSTRVRARMTNLSAPLTVNTPSRVVTRSGAAPSLSVSPPSPMEATLPAPDFWLAEKEEGLPSWDRPTTTAEADRAWK